MMKQPNCYDRGCIHFEGVENLGDETTERLVCKAFPNGIPMEIAFGPNLHFKPYPGDNGIQYKGPADKTGSED